MAIHSIDSQKFRLTISRDELREVKGKVKLGEVISCQIHTTLKKGRILLNLKGTTLIAESSLNFKDGEIVDLQVKEITPKMILQLIPKGEDRLSRFMEIKNKLKSLNLPVNKENLEIVKKLMEYNLPLNRGIVYEILQNLKNLIKSTLQDIEVLVFLKAKDIPFNNTTFNAIKFYLFEKEFLFDELKKLKDTLKDISLDKNLKEGFKKLWDRLYFNFEKDRFSSDIKMFLANLGISLDKDIQEGGKLNLKNLLLKMKENLLNIKESLSPKEIKFLETLDKSLLHLSSLMLLNQDQGEIRYFFWDIPLIVSEEEQPVKIKIKYKKKKKEEKIDLNNLNISFLFKSSSLGEILVNLYLRNKEVSGYIGLEDLMKKNFVSLYIEELKERIKNLGYSLKALKCMVLPEAEEEFFSDRVLRLDRLSKIDIRI